MVDARPSLKYLQRKFELVLVQLVNNTMISDANRVIIKYCPLSSEDFEKLNSSVL